MTSADTGLVRKYGRPPYRAALLHGGPGAPGYMAPVARELSAIAGILEPLQSAHTLDGQVVELRTQLEQHSDGPSVLIGSSWGAVLALLLAARRPGLAARLILIGSAVFDAASSTTIMPRRLERLSADDRRRCEELDAAMKSAGEAGRDQIAAEWGKLLSRADQYDPLPDVSEPIEVQYDVLKAVWADFVALRDTPGALEREFSRISAPVLVLHGEYDPHPIEGIRPMLERCLSDIRFVILSQCGHYPWQEKHARARFFELLRAEL
ncbi:alpha/beta fold hydrolase [candidate division GN15 bacterium]|nr:alpha/beta fold hydrolase [candidate division GN15 bacterium]